MKKIAVVLVVLFSFMICSIALAAAPSKGKIIGKPFNKNWKVKADRNDSGFYDVLFSDDGKTYYALFNNTPSNYDDGSIGGCCGKYTVFVWSPDHKYLLIVWESNQGAAAPILKDGYWRYAPALYDPSRHVVFEAPANLLGADWVKGSEHDLILQFSGGNKSLPGATSKSTIEEWKKDSSKISIEPYLQWLASWVVDKMKKNQLDSLYSLTKGFPKRDVDSIAMIKEEYNPRNITGVHIAQLDSQEEGAKGISVTIITKSGSGYISFYINVVAKNNFPLPPKIVSVNIGKEYVH